MKKFPLNKILAFMLIIFTGNSEKIFVPYPAPGNMPRLKWLLFIKGAPNLETILKELSGLFSNGKAIITHETQET